MTGEVQSIEDFTTDPDFEPRLRAAILSADPGSGLAAIRSTLAVPMKRDDVVVGVVVIARSQTGPFPARQIELLQTFADQAVIAIENARLFGEVQARTRDLSEALEQQTATADVLKVISRSAFDLQAVFDTLLGSAVALSGADSGVLCVRDGDAFRLKSFVNKSPDLVRFLAETPITPGPGSVMGRVALSGRIEWIEDTLADSALSMRSVIRQTNDDRALVGVPLLRDARIEGGIVLGRSEPGRFSARSLELTQTFADQAVIAIENARLFDEVQARTRDLTEALQQQTATADVLKVISRSAFDVQTVLDTLVTSAVKLCGAGNGIIYLKSGDAFAIKAVSIESEEAEVVRRLREDPPVTGRGSIGARILLTGEIQHVSDIQEDADYDPALRAVQVNRALLGVPLKRDATIVGAIVLARRQPGAYTQRQIELAQTFADQAVIAIENARLFDEVQARTKDLQESLKQQTATADVLKVISRSTFDLQPVLETLVETVVRLCDADMAFILRREGEVFRAGAEVGFSREYRDFLQSHPIRVDRETVTGRAALERRIVQIADVSTDPEYTLTESTRLSGQRTALGVPLFREGQVIGVFVLARRRVEPFTERQIELVATFADQAGIAVENTIVRRCVVNETQEALQQQTATADVLKVISRSAFDLQAVFDTLISSAVELCGAYSGSVCVRDGDVFRFRASAGQDNEALTRYLEAHPATPGRGSMVGRVLLSGKMEAIPDCREDPEYEIPMDALNQPSRSLMGVPLLKRDGIEGALVLTRKEPGPFADRQIEILQTFADQAVIAIENVRLFDEVQARTKDLQEALQQQTATADVLKVISRSAFDLQAVFDTLLSSAVKLAGAAAGSMCVRDGGVFRYRATSGLSLDLVQHLAAHPAAPGRGSTADRVLLSGEVVCISDVLKDHEYVLPTMQLGTPMRSTLGVPLLRDDRVEGALVLVRLEPGTFHQRQIDLVKTFADQAVIAIENVRLFDEVQARTRELAASLENLQKAQDRLVQSEKLASLGQLTAGIAHEIKNPLNFVNNFSVLSRELVDELADVIKARAARGGPARGSR